MTDTNRLPAIEALGEAERPGWLRNTIGGTYPDVWISVAKIEAVVFDGNDVEIVTTGGSRYLTLWSLEETFARIEDARTLTPRPTVNAGEDTFGTAAILDKMVAEAQRLDLP